MARWVSATEFKKEYPAFSRRAYELFQAKNFPAVLNGSNWVINLDEVDKWLLERKGKEVIPRRD